ncbi:protein obstructor-E isoform X2 [Contarinia nasturtii]|uniref:protein obstructor-E isoform X2 n=1 Tax=Contarinia nasturtii TaxID=265458 RepID=UPI0012D4783B|nr:protein obstructor-E isoform X2 [Contarinia nasturtii]
MNRFVIVLVLASLAFTNAQKGSNTQFICPNDKSGQYKDAVQCDKYYECDDGVATERLCPDGLVFDETIRLKNKCDQPFNVDCEDRTELQPPKGTNEKCPRKNGFFAHPNPGVCNVFFNCIDGDAIEIKCTAGLHFDEYSGTCVWPDSANREGCKSEEELNQDDDAFRCPSQSTKSSDSKGQVVAHPKYPHESDCQKFYVCLNAVDKRALGCPAGQVYNDATEMCDAPENVPGCEDWYKDESDEIKPSKKSRK